MIGIPYDSADRPGTETLGKVVIKIPQLSPGDGFKVPLCCGKATSTKKTVVIDKLDRLLSSIGLRFVSNGNLLDSHYAFGGFHGSISWSDLRLNRLCSPASAAQWLQDMPMKAPPMPVEPVYNWTGFYIGGNVGGGWDDIKTLELAPGTAAFPTGTVFPRLLAAAVGLEAYRPVATGRQPPISSLALRANFLGPI